SRVIGSNERDLTIGLHVELEVRRAIGELERRTWITGRRLDGRCCKVFLIIDVRRRRKHILMDQAKRGAENHVRAEVPRQPESWREVIPVALRKCSLRMSDRAR